MKNAYRVILIGLAVFGVVYASTGPEKKTKEVEKKTKEAWKYNPIELCKFSVSLEVGHYIQLKECHKRKIKLEQVDCESIGKDHGDFPCYKGSDVIEVRANFPAIFRASIDKNGSGEDMLKEVNLYWENGVNTIQGTGDWEELKLCLDAWKVEIWKSGGTVGTVEIGEITIGVRPPTQEEKDAQATLQKEAGPDCGCPKSEKALEEVSPEAVQPSEESGDVVPPPE
ncbi:MAG: hypothetical protein HQ580_17215 [Planctomycetes bacterium]|nr:hypothetical protein [Planctomycetota bacterium]